MADLVARLEPFLILARSTRGAAAAKVILDATAAAGVYVFAELLELPTIQVLQNDPNFAKHHSLLRLFAYGTLEQYNANKDTYPPLTPTHLLKLKHLTLVSLALQHRSLPYSLLLEKLQLDSTRQLEDLIIDVIYSGLMSGKMHHHQAILHIDSVAGRDIDIESLKTVQAGLQNWCQTAENLLQSLDNQISTIRKNAAEEAQSQQQYKAYRDEQYIAIATEIRNNTSINTKSGRNGGQGKMGDKSVLGTGTNGGGRNQLPRNPSLSEQMAGLRKSKRSRD